MTIDHTRQPPHTVTTHIEGLRAPTAHERSDVVWVKSAEGTYFLAFATFSFLSARCLASRASYSVFCSFWRSIRRRLRERR